MITRQQRVKETREPKQSRRTGKTTDLGGQHARARVEAENDMPAGDGVACTGRPRSEFGG